MSQTTKITGFSVSAAIMSRSGAWRQVYSWQYGVAVLDILSLNLLKCMMIRCYKHSPNDI